MTQISIPDDLYDDLRRAALTTNRSLARLVEDYLRDALQDDLVAELGVDEQRELSALRHLSDEGLEDVARARLPAALQARVTELLDKGNSGALMAEEYAELGYLLERADRLMLRKAEALALLHARGIQLILGGDQV